MNEQNWYVYHNGEQLGPFGSSQVKQMIDTKMISQDAYLYKVGWKDWRPIEDTIDELGLEAASESRIDNVPNRRAAAPRATINGRVVVHNNGQLVIGSGANISATGMFVETKDQIFTVGEKLKLSVRADGFQKAFNVLAQVVRFNSDPRYPVGYGLKFEDLDKEIAQDIQKALDEQNRDQSNEKAAQ